jgi:hypothetical protein
MAEESRAFPAKCLALKSSTAKYSDKLKSECVR